MWEEFKKVLDRFNSFLLSTHVNPDGDGLGSEIALASLIKSLKKEARIVNASATPSNYQFMDPDNEILVYDMPQAQEAMKKCQAVIILDCGAFERLRELGDILQKSAAYKICIDHHLTQGSGFDLMVVDDKSPASGMMIYDLIRQMKGAVNRKEALALYTAIMRETGSFRFSNSTPEVHRITADLIELGVEPQDVYEQVYEDSSLARLQLLGHVLADLRTDRDGKLAWMTATKELLDRYQVPEADLDGFIDSPRALGSARLLVFFIEKEGRVRVSFRSKGDLDVNALARSFDGGGHRNAAGATVKGTLLEVKEKVLEAAKAVLMRAGL